MSTEAPSTLRQPAEWEAHDACWLAWPSHGELWQENLKPAQAEFTGLCRTIAQGGERLKILVPTAEARRDAEAALAGLDVEFHSIPFGDIWMRDTAPIFVQDSGRLAAVSFAFNGWGGKYALPFDDLVSARVSASSGGKILRREWILEGGSIEADGEGTLLTSRQCLLNPNRNPHMNQAQIEAALARDLGARKVLWLGDGLINDHTDGHIDTIARFVGPARVACMDPTGKDDPNAAILKRIRADLESMTDAQGRKLEVVGIPSPGRIEDEDGRVMPASYLNFYIANRSVAVPVYGSANDAAAVEAIARLFPTRKTVGLSAFAILSGGGAFHCITQQEPSCLA